MGLYYLRCTTYEYRGPYNIQDGNKECDEVDVSNECTASHVTFKIQQCQIILGGPRYGHIQFFQVITYSLSEVKIVLPHKFFVGFSVVFYRNVRSPWILIFVSSSGIGVFI
jgi:hypothetical protein